MEKKITKEIPMSYSTLYLKSRVEKNQDNVIHGESIIFVNKLVSTQQLC